MVRHRTCRSRRHTSLNHPSKSSCTPNEFQSCNLPKSLVLWGLCFALFQQNVPRVAASSPQFAKSVSWQGAPVNDNSVFQGGGSASSDDGEDFAEIDLEKEEQETPPELPFVTAEQVSSTVEQRDGPNASSDIQIVVTEGPDGVNQAHFVETKRHGDVEDGSESFSPPRRDEEEDSESESEEESDSQSEGDNDGTLEDPSFQSSQEGESTVQSPMPPQESPDMNHEVVVSDAEGEWFDSDDAAVEVAVEISTISEDHMEATQREESSDEGEEELPQASLAPQGAKPVAVKDSDPTVSGASPKEDADESDMSIQEVLINESETDSEADEEEGSMGNEVSSEGETYDWSGDEQSDVVDEEIEIVPTKPIVPAVATKLESLAPVTPVRSAKEAYRSTASAAAEANFAPTRRKKGRTIRSSRQYGSSHYLSPSSQPLKTLEKLQHMLDETDYMTATPGSRGDAMRRELTDAKKETVAFDQAIMAGDYEQKEEFNVVHPTDSNMGKEKSAEGDKLWMSKDRMKYKKQQARIRRAKQEQRRLQEQLRSPPLHPNSSDDEATDDTDDGLGFALPQNLPVYFSDAEGTTTDLTDVDNPPVYHHTGQPKHPFQPPPPPFEQRGTYQYPPPPGYIPPNVHHMPPDQNMGQPMPPYYPQNPYAPYGSYGPYNQQQMASQYAAAWAAAASGRMPQFGAGRPPYRRPYPSAQANSAGLIEPPKLDGSQPVDKLNDTKTGAAPELKLDRKSVGAISSMPVAAEFPVATTSLHVNAPYQLAPAAYIDAPSSLAEASSHLSFDSIQKLSVFGIGIALLCYSAVSPRTLPPIEYNEMFYENIKIVSLMMIAPLLTFLMVFDPKENDINKAVNAFYMAFTVGYSMAFLLQIVFTTAVRLGVFAWFEPDVFQLTPQVPSLVLPWVLRENRYRPKRITLFAADFATSCVAGPIIEEYVKLKILQWSVRLPRNFKWIKKASSKNKKKKRKRAEAVPRYPGDPEVTNINAYVSQMLAVSIGIKLADSARRILMYTKATDENKGLYALCRGIFPIQELCGTMTALALAKRDVLGWEMPLWKMLAPAVVIHGMANFRGMKPLFKWNSATPWSEMQLLPWNAADDSTLAQLANKGFAKLVWLIILGRVLGYCIKNYYLIRRQAVKRTTTYAGKRAAFSAELAAAEMLKKTAKDK